MKTDKNIDKIIVKGARTHNLKDINVEMPRNKMVVITGVSGSGKSSLAFDTIFAEGQSVPLWRRSRKFTITCV
jgi:excinuclease ABC subunit A